MAADRILTWFFEDQIGDGVEQGPIYYLDRDYTPIALRISQITGLPVGQLWPGKYPENGYRRNRVTSLTKLQEIARNYPRAA